MFRSLLIVVSFFSLLNNGHAQEKITVCVEGIRHNDGKVAIGLYKSEKTFPIPDQAYKRAIVTPSITAICYSFSDIHPGKYAIAVFHDENENQRIDKNWLGIPTESYGFSRNKFGVLGPPDFDEATFMLEDGKEIQLTIKLSD